MTVKFYANVLEYTSGEKSFEIEGVQDLRMLISKLGEHYGERFAEFLLGDNTYFFLVNGNGIMITGGLGTPLRSDDIVEVLPRVGGG